MPSYNCRSLGGRGALGQGRWLAQIGSRCSGVTTCALDKPRCLELERWTLSCVAMPLQAEIVTYTISEIFMWFQSQTVIVSTALLLKEISEKRREIRNEVSQICPEM